MKKIKTILPFDIPDLSKVENAALKIAGFLEDMAELGAKRASEMKKKVKAKVEEKIASEPVKDEPEKEEHPFIEVIDDPTELNEAKPDADGEPEKKESVSEEIAKIVEEIKNDVKVIRQRDPAAASDAEVALLYSGFHAVTSYRIAHALHLKGHVFSARALSQVTKALTGIEIHPAAKIGEGLFIDHGSGVVIGETAEIGSNCTLYQGVTLGGTGKQTGKRHPTIGDDVLVGAGAILLGPVNVGSRSKVAAGAVVIDDIPDDSTAVGVPARVVRHFNERVPDFDQIHIPDPVAKEITKLNDRIDAAEKKIEELSKEDN